MQFCEFLTSFAFSCIKQIYNFIDVISLFNNDFSVLFNCSLLLLFFTINWLFFPLYSCIILCQIHAPGFSKKDRQKKNNLQLAVLTRNMYSATIHVPFINRLIWDIWHDLKVDTALFSFILFLLCITTGWTNYSHSYSLQLV